MFRNISQVAVASWVLFTVVVLNNLPRCACNPRRSLRAKSHDAMLFQVGDLRNLTRCRRDNCSFNRIFLATVPRSGNSFTLKVMQSPSGKRSCTVFRSRDKTWDERAGCYYRNRDFHRDTVKPSGDETTVVKSHHPFLGPQVSWSQQFSVACTNV